MGTQSPPYMAQMPIVKWRLRPGLNEIMNEGNKALRWGIKFL
jgi:hypothetical protein